MNTNDFYIGLLTLSVAFASFSTIFGFFKIQTINSEIQRCCDNFREWVKFKFEENRENKKALEYLLITLRMDKEPDSWIDYALVEHINAYRANDSEGRFREALKDYSTYIAKRERFLKKAPDFILKPCFIFAVLAFVSLRMLVDSSSDYALVWVAPCFLVSLLGFYFLIESIFFFMQSMNDKSINIPPRN